MRRYKIADYDALLRDQQSNPDAAVCVPLQTDSLRYVSKMYENILDLDGYTNCL